MLIKFLAALLLFPVFGAHGANPIADQLVRRGLAPLFDNRLQMEKVDISLLRRTIVIENAVLAQPPGFPKGIMLRARSISLRYALFPFLRQRYFISDIAVIQPEIVLIQGADGKTNLDYYFTRLTTSREKQRDMASLLALEELSVVDGTIKFSQPHFFPDRQPLFEFTGVNFIVRNLAFPNSARNRSPFSFSAIINTAANPVALKGNGYLVAAPGPLTFTAHTSLQGVPLPEFAFLCPRSPVCIKSGTARVCSEVICKNNRLASTHRVEIGNLNIAHKNIVKKILLGLPTNMVIRFLQNEKGMLALDFSICGDLDALKADPQKAVGDAVYRSFRAAIAGKRKL